MPEQSFFVLLLHSLAMTESEIESETETDSE